MRLKALSMKKKKAEGLYKEALDAYKATKLPYYKKLKTVTYHLRKGHKIIDVKQAIKIAGLNRKREPRMAIARADMKKVAFTYKSATGYHFIEPLEYKWGEITGKSVFAMGWVFNDAKTNIETVVPPVPPRYLPKSDLSKYYILWEVERWIKLPKDPILLKRITKNLFYVVARWHLTKLEKLILKEVAL